MSRDDEVVLAKMAGDYREAPPAPPLREHFRCLWMHTTPRDRVAPIVVVPDGCVDLLWLQGGLFVAGPDVTAARPALAPGTTLVGLRFRPGAAAQWLGLPMSDIVGRQVDLRDLWGARSRRIAEAIGAAEAPAEVAARLQTGLARLAPDIDPPPRDMALVFRRLGRCADGAGPALPEILDRLDISERTLRRRCHDHFGYGPKTLDRILRFQRFLGLARTTPAAGLTALAFAAGYADQAHLSREVRRLSHLSPRAVVRQLAG